jgi:predicted nucleic acid-binding protein
MTESTDLVVFDSSFLLVALRPGVSVPPDPATGQPIVRPRERIEHLINEISERGSRVIVPTPALAEALVIVGPGKASGELVTGLRRATAITVEAFDQLAAIECAQLTTDAVATGTKRGRANNQPWQKVKVDRQIVAIAKVRGASTIYTTDAGLAALATAEGFQVRHIADLPLPPVDAQVPLFPDQHTDPEAE